MITVVGISHRGTSVALRERYAVPADSQTEFLKSVQSALSGAGVALLSTCNRVEVYVHDGANVGADQVAGVVLQLLEAHAGLERDAELREAVYVHYGETAVRHAFRVAASLESMVVGEPQILGQFKEAHARAEASAMVGPTLGRALRAALAAAKRVRTETAIGEGQVSIASVAVDLARGIVGALRGRHVLCVGAGAMAESALRAMQHEGATITVCNRGEAQRTALAETFSARAVPLSELEIQMQSADVVVVSTGSAGYVLTLEMAERVMRKRRGRALFVIDVAVPRNVDPEVHRLEDVYVYNVDDLERRVDDGSARRGDAVQAAELVVDQEIAAWRTWVHELGAKEAVVLLRARVSEVLTAELERTLAGRLKGLAEPEREALRVMVDAMASKLSHGPISTLKGMPAEAQAGAVGLLTELFGLAAVSPNQSSERAS